MLLLGQLIDNMLLLIRNYFLSMSLLKWLFLFLFIENSHHFANTLESILEIIQRNVADNCLGVHVSSLQRNLQIDPKRTIHNQLSGPHF
jgi:hypothetical protein